ncbi:ArsR/SmtB family transcription factor [Paracoccus albus]|uniref:ArsR/SmtB family transcription factor n=1 Tax=Paracoccus albus TaxID=3017784 RepID=UPI0022F0F27C|nr:helix-turn-helix transcriptional regulator [Paracoccus albus]WBU61547.1 helix-turn-helix transcriptional regulator [Paracoccus albus]
MDRVFSALSHSSRREMLDLVRDKPGLSVGELASNFDVSRIAVMNHIKVLEEAQLVISEKDGRARRLYLNAVPIQAIHERWTDNFSAHWLDRMSLIKSVAEAAASRNRRDKDE